MSLYWYEARLRILEACVVAGLYGSIHEVKSYIYKPVAIDCYFFQAHVEVDLTDLTDLTDIIIESGDDQECLWD